MLLAFDATTIRGNKTGVGYYSARLLERLTAVGGDDGEGRAGGTPSRNEEDIENDSDDESDGD